MDTRVAFFRHPLEIIVNSIYLIIIGKILFNATVVEVAIALMIEGALETFHHSNIKIHKKINFIGYIIQTPAMHLVHHEYKLHRYNYSPFLWDFVFKTAKIPNIDKKKLGFSYSNKVFKILIFKHPFKH